MPSVSQTLTLFKVCSLIQPIPMLLHLITNANHILPRTWRHDPLHPCAKPLPRRIIIPLVPLMSSTSVVLLPLRDVVFLSSISSAASPSSAKSTELLHVFLCSGEP